MHKLYLKIAQTYLENKSCGLLVPNQILSHEAEWVVGCTVTVTMAGTGVELTAYARRDGHGSAGNRRRSSCASFNMSQSGHQKPWRAETRYLAPSLLLCFCFSHFLPPPISPRSLLPPTPPLIVSPHHSHWLSAGYYQRVISFLRVHQPLPASSCGAHSWSKGLQQAQGSSCSSSLPGATGDWSALTVFAH